MENLTMNEYSKKRLDETYLVVYAIKNEINIKKGDYITETLKIMLTLQELCNINI